MDIEVIGLFMAPIIVFIVIVLPLWLILHYLAKAKNAKGLSKEDEGMLTQLWEIATRMESRIETLETILDDEAPGWRKKS